jgi:hypothetical protein
LRPKPQCQRRLQTCAILPSANFQCAVVGLQKECYVCDVVRLGHPCERGLLDQASDHGILLACVYRKLNPNVLMMKPAQDGVRNLWRRIAEPDERPAHPFAKTDAF